MESHSVRPRNASDLLLMFLYLEVPPMDARYLRLGQLPVRFPLYIAMRRWRGN
jgi:phosphate starvation-inducible membrane PsiE